MDFLAILDLDTPQQPQQHEAYLALARKYRSRYFGELIGQDVLVRTLSNAIQNNRIHHAYMFTGIRGTGKTSTARILAKAINYTGADGTAGPTTGPTDDCRICQAITQDRHPDVIELDAASHTGIDDIKDLLEGVRYAPVEARYKVYIIDEVHMLSKSAFNALLKTLEEPPPKTVFMFATTEIRKVPVTILSRCQRFDLRRIDTETLQNHFKTIAQKEHAVITDDALQAIAMAADGSARDGLSLLDQAIARAAGDDISLDLVRAMLGQADQDAVVHLLQDIWQGDAAKALNTVREFYTNGVDPAMLAQDMLSLLHHCAVAKSLPNQTGRLGLQPATRQTLNDALNGLSMGTLTRQWQIMLKGLGDVHSAPQPQAALEMAILRLIYAAALPPLEQLLKQAPDAMQSPLGAALPQPTASSTPHAPVARATGTSGGTNFTTHAVAQPQATPAAQPTAQQAEPAFASLRDIVAKCEAEREMLLASDLTAQVRLVKLSAQSLDIVMLPAASKDLPKKLQQKLREWTGQNWLISVSTQGGQATLREQAQAAQQAAIAAVEEHPSIQRLRKTFPPFTITNVSKIDDQTADQNG